MPFAFRFSPDRLKALTDSSISTGVLLTELVKYAGSKDVNITTFFEYAGGMLNVSTPDTFQQYTTSLFRLDLGGLQVGLADINLLLSKINQSTMETLFLFRRQELESKIDVIRAAFDAAQKSASDEAEKHSGVAFLGAIAADLSAVVKDIVALAAAVETSNEPGAVEAAVDLGASYKKLLEQMSYVPETGTEFDRLRSNLERARFALGALLSELARERSRVSALIQAAEHSQVTSRTTAESRRGYRAVLFQDMLKTILISYFSDPTRSSSILHMNLLALRSWLGDDFPLREPYFRVRDIVDKTCSAIRDCLGLHSATAKEYSADRGGSSH